MKFTLKENLLIGTATAATQIEGGDENNNWARFAKEGKVDDGTSPVRADDHYNRWREDIDLMADMHLEIYRFGVEWSRILPQPGQPDEAVIERYRAELLLLKEKGGQHRDG
jgi:beta-glucosidase